MKKLGLFIFLSMIVFAGSSYADNMGMGNSTKSDTTKQMSDMPADKVKVYCCSMDNYTSDMPGKCPMCGAKMDEKEMTAADAQAAIEKSKEMIKKRA